MAGSNSLQDLSQAVLNPAKNLTISASSIRDIKYSRDGLYFYVLDGSAKQILQYQINTPGDLSSATLTYTLDLSSVFTNTTVYSFDLANNDSTIFCLSFFDKKLYKINLSTSKMLSSADIIGYDTFILPSIDGYPFGLNIAYDGLSLIIYDNLPETIKKYSLLNPFDIQNLEFDSETSGTITYGIFLGVTQDELSIYSSNSTILSEYELTSPLNLQNEIINQNTFSTNYTNEIGGLALDENNGVIAIYEKGSLVVNSVDIPIDQGPSDPITMPTPAPFVFSLKPYHFLRYNIKLEDIDLSDYVTSCYVSLNTTEVYLSLVLGGLDLIDVLTANPTGTFYISQEYVNSKTGEVEQQTDIIDAVFELFTFNLGSTSSSLNITARKSYTLATPKTLSIDNPTYISNNQIRLPFNSDINVGDTIQHDLGDFVVGAITYNLGSSTDMTLTA